MIDEAPHILVLRQLDDALKSARRAAHEALLSGWFNDLSAHQTLREIDLKLRQSERLILRDFRLPPRELPKTIVVTTGPYQGRMAQVIRQEIDPGLYYTLIESNHPDEEIVYLYVWGHNGEEAVL